MSATAETQTAKAPRRRVAGSARPACDVGSGSVGGAGLRPVSGGAHRRLARLIALVTGWRLAALAVAVLLAIPVSVVLASLFAPEPAIWQHLMRHVLPGLLLNTAVLAIGVGLGSAVIGISTAWLIAVHEFPGRRFFSWALLLPLAIPAYVTAFVAIGLLDYTGPLQRALRAAFGGSDWFPPIRSAGGVIAVMTLALFPYVYLLARNAFTTHGKRALEAAQSLGLNRRQGFFRVALPMARPWIAGGVILVVMETLADFGTVAAFNYDTFTTAIYKTWFGLFSLNAAAQLASILILLVFVVLFAESQLRAKARYVPAGRAEPHARSRLSGVRGWIATGYAALILGVAFVVPTVQLVVWAAGVFEDAFDARYFEFITHSLVLSGVAALLAIAVGVILTYAGRRHADLPTRGLIRVSLVGYAIPGAVLAVGVFVPVAWLDGRIIATARSVFGMEAGPVLQGTLLVMLIAYLVRFLAVAFNPVDSAMQRITPGQEEAARSLGLGTRAVLARVHLPLLRNGLIAGLILVFVDVMKEMPITLMTRPFGWDTLAVRIFELTSEGQWEQAALPAVALVLVGLGPLMLLNRHAERC